MNFSMWRGFPALGHTFTSGNEARNIGVSKRTRWVLAGMVGTFLLLHRARAFAGEREGPQQRDRRGALFCYGVGNDLPGRAQNGVGRHSVMPTERSSKKSARSGGDNDGSLIVPIGYAVLAPFHPCRNEWLLFHL